MGFNLTAAGTEGYWGPVTSSLDWCEENHLLHTHIAEYWNTFSNLWYLFWVAIGWIVCAKVGAEFRSWVVYAGLGIVGCGSFMFHASLLFETQMADELPMIYASCLQVYSILLSSPRSKSHQFPVLIFLFLLAYGALVAVSIFVPLKQVLALRGGKEGHRVNGLFFLLWNVENHTCDHIRTIRTDIGYPYRILFELHAWWHFLTAIGCYGGSLLTIYMRLLAIGRTDVELKWVGLVPYLTTLLDAEGVREANRRALKFKKE
ncbi:ceramidase-domain-containing protein [Chytridium lagenaria]|nr:ceramidase-domain-containing protein [Chytridium lagenaria]